MDIMRLWYIPSCCGQFHLTIWLILSVNTIYGQSGDSLFRSISVGMGATHYRLMDEAFSHERVMYRGTTFTAAIDHQRYTDKYYFMAGIHMSSGNASAPGQRPDANLIYLRLATGYARHVLSNRVMNAKGRLYIGGQLASSNYVVENEDEHDEVTLSLYHAINFFAIQKTTISSRNQLSLSLSLPLAGFVKRANYDGGINQDLEQEFDSGGAINMLFNHTKFSGLNPLTLPELTIDFARRIRPKTDFVLSYQFNYLKNTEIAPIALYSNALIARLRFNFNKQL